ncbi:MAG: glycosyl hydrolase [Saprospiraceae bacterium]|nr:glycosyl hydrolase [Saprospiraceae bacterium]
MKLRSLLLCLVCFFVFAEEQLYSQEKSFDESIISSLQFRCIGPFRGGRSAAVTGVEGKPNLFYFGGTGGGVWRTKDGGRTWENVSDGFFGGSIGSIEVAPSDHNVIYVGGGECTVRGNVSFGSGIWKSEDAGKTWKNMGLKNSRHIPRIKVHPKDYNIVYAAVLGDLYKSSDDRGLYKSIDGGNTWKKILFVSADAGAVDFAMDPLNPRIIYTSFWKVRRTPYSLSSGGHGSSLWKSIDSGENWTDISRNEGMPDDTLGIIGIAASHTKPDRIFVIVENKNGGVFRSDDGGKKWIKVNDDRSLRQRAWYYSRIYTDTKDDNTVYVVNVAYHKSIDGGKNFLSRYAPHGDHHDLWIAPEDPKRMIMGDDGGAQITYDGGDTWSTYHNQPTAQFYRVTTDNSYPYRIYVAQQDNSSVRIKNFSDNTFISEKDWESTAGGECATIAVDPIDNNIVYGGEYHGLLTRYNHHNNTNRMINVWPEDNMGHGAIDAKYRFQWNYPVFFSPHNPKKLYVASNHLHVTENEGQSWKTISPDLTTNDTAKQKSSGGPITQDNTSVEYYCTIFAAAESSVKAGILWTGSDDGLVHISQDDGKTWMNVTPLQMPKWTMINSIETDPFNEAACYLAATAYKNGDYTPYLYYTNNFGKSWKLITNDIGKEHFTRVIRADKKKQGLLFCGTEQGLYMSLNNGDTWSQLKLNLPIVPITDMTIKDNDLVIATQGRSIWILDDIDLIRTYNSSIKEKQLHLFQPAICIRNGSSYSSPSLTLGQNPTSGIVAYYYLKNKPLEKDTVRISLFDERNKKINEFSNHSKINKLEVKEGSNKFNWNLRYPDADRFEGMILWSYGLQGPVAKPGKYKLVLEAQGNKVESLVDVLADPRSTATSSDFEKQFEFVNSVGSKLDEAHQCIKEIRDLRAQLNQFRQRFKKDSAHKKILYKIDFIDSVSTHIEKQIYQTQNKSSQDPLNFPVRLNDKLANLMGLNVSDDYPPTDQALEVRQYLFNLTDKQLNHWAEVKTNHLKELNRIITQSNVEHVIIKEVKKEE